MNASRRARWSPWQHVRGAFIHGGGAWSVQPRSFSCICRVIMADKCWASWDSFTNIYGEEGIGRRWRICGQEWSRRLQPWRRTPLGIRESQRIWDYEEGIATSTRGRVSERSRDTSNPCTSRPAQLETPDTYEVARSGPQRKCGRGKSDQRCKRQHSAWKINDDVDARESCKIR
jgi:hypothetical protein